MGFFEEHEAKRKKKQMDGARALINGIKSPPSKTESEAFDGFFDGVIYIFKIVLLLFLPIWLITIFPKPLKTIKKILKLISAIFMLPFLIIISAAFWIIKIIFMILQGKLDTAGHQFKPYSLLCKTEDIYDWITDYDGYWGA